MENEESILNNEKVTENEERNISEIYSHISARLEKYFEVKEESIKEAINAIVESFKSFNLNKIDFNNTENLCGYFRRYSTFSTALVRNRCLGALEQCDELVNKMQKSEVNIVCLGGGPGTDFLGFCIAWYNFASAKKIKHGRIVNITIVDFVKRYASFYNIIEFFIREGNYGSLSNFFRKYQINSTFLCVDLFSESPPSKYEEDLKHADIVFLSRVLDAQNFKEKEPESLIQNVVNYMKKEALLTLIDSCIYLYKINGVKEIYSCSSSEFILTAEVFSGGDISSKATISIYQK